MEEKQIGKDDENFMRVFDKVARLEAELAEAQKKPGLLVYSIWEEQERQHLVDIGADCTRISAQKAWQVQQAVIDSLTAELAILKDEYTCEECEKSLVDPETGVTAFCIGCWNAVITKLRAEIDRLTAERDKWRDAYEEDDIRTNGLCEKVNRLTAELKAKDEILRELLAYAEEGLLIDEHLAAHIVQALKGGGLAKKQ